jgi:hypothetical protein
VKNACRQAKKWDKAELEDAVRALYETDRIIKLGGPKRLAAENLVFSITA